MMEKQQTVMKIIDYIEKHLSEEIRLDDIAKEAGYSKYHLNRIFMDITGKTIHKYMQERRLSESAIKLASGNINIIEIAQDAGYTSQQAYTLAFRQLFHCTPQVYRELNRKLVYRERNQHSRRFNGVNGHHIFSEKVLHISKKWGIAA